MNPDTAQSVFSGICPTDITQSGTQGSHEYHEANINQDTAQYNQFLSQSSSIFQDSHTVIKAESNTN